MLAEGLRHGLGWWSSQRPLVVVSFLQLGMGHREGGAYGIASIPHCEEEHGARGSGCRAPLYSVVVTVSRGGR